MGQTWASIKSFRRSFKAVGTSSFKGHWALFLLGCVGIIYVLWGKTMSLDFILPVLIFQVYVVCKRQDLEFCQLAAGYKGQVKNSYLILFLGILALSILQGALFMLVTDFTSSVITGFAYIKLLIIGFVFFLMPLAFIKKMTAWWAYWLAVTIVTFVCHFTVVKIVTGSEAFLTMQVPLALFSGQQSELLFVGAAAVFALIGLIVGFSLSCFYLSKSFAFTRLTVQGKNGNYKIVQGRKLKKRNKLRIQ